jgi:hypothetical protein
MEKRVSRVFLVNEAKVPKSLSLLDYRGYGKFFCLSTRETKQTKETRETI